MAEEQRGSRGKSYGNHKSYGSGRPGNRGGKGFKPRGNGGKSYGHKSGGFHNDDRKGGYRKGNGGGYRRGDRDFHRAGESEGQERRFHNGPRKFNRDGERRDDRRGGYRGNRGDNPRYQRDGERSGFRHDDRRDGERRNFRHDGDRRDFRRDDGERRGGRNFHKDGDRRDFRRDNQRRDFHKDRDQRPEGEERREFTREEKMEYREAKRGEYLSKPRRNSDGTMSFPSQNPYTDRRPDEPKMPKGMEWSMLSKDERERLRGLSKEHAENIGLHILAAFALEESDPELALEHAKWVARQASRIDFARETLAFVAYRQGDYKLALREFRTAYRMNGFLDYLPFIADCERGVGEPKKAVELALSDEGKQLHGAPKVEMFLVYAGALGDLEMWDKAIEVVHTVGRSQGLPGEYRMRAVQAEQYFLEEAGRSKEAEQLNDLLDRLEDQYADEEIDENSDDVVIDHDLEDITDDSDVLEKLGIDPDEAQYAPDPEQEYGDEDDEAEDGDAESDEADETETDSANDAEADDSAESADSDSTEPETETEE